MNHAEAAEIKKEFAAWQKWSEKMIDGCLERADRLPEKSQLRIEYESEARGIAAACKNLTDRFERKK